MLRVLRGIARAVFILVVLVAIGVGGFVGVTLAQFGRELPDYQQVANYVPATGSKVYDSAGGLMTEFESEHRIPVAIDKVPQRVIEAFLAAEDRDFYQHRGVNPGAIFRAAMADILRLRRGQRPIGASTITQQVVRHFLLSNEVSVSRKVKEAMLAYRIEQMLSKQRILEIYLNEIYLGAGAYGVAAAADTYFQKPLDRLTLAEAAFLAALPKAPNNYNPIHHLAAAQARRDWVLASMADLGWIGATQAKAAMAEPLVVHLRGDSPANPPPDEAGYFTEEVRRELVARFGEKAVYEGGLRVRTSYRSGYQQMAETAFRRGLVEYDRRHGWRGPLAHLPSAAAAQGALSGMADPPGPGSWQLAAVMAVDSGGATLALKGGGGHIPLDEFRWARRTLADQRVGAGVRQARDVVSPGDIVLVEPVATDAPAKGSHAPLKSAPSYALRQMPDVSGGLVVMDPKTGRVLALVGGWSFQQSQFDRAVQAKRQPGSAFKPFVYITALQNGFTPSSIVDDSPIELSQGPGLPPWRPVNYESGYVGPTTLEDALIHSRNLATARLATMIGLPAIAHTVQNFDVMDRMPLYYSMSLGAGETTLLRLTTAYAMLDNGGHWLLPSVIDVVQDRNGRVVYQKGVKDCTACLVAAGPGGDADPGARYRASGPADPSAIALPNATYADKAVLYEPTRPDPMVSQQADYEILAMMQGVVQRGTGTAVAAVGKPLAGKTGTTSDWFDAWFVGFSPDLVAGVFVGFDEPRTLGTGEVGGHVAAPIFRDFMAAALKDVPAKPFPVPPGAAPLLANARPAPSSAGELAGDDDEPPIAAQSAPMADDDSGTAMAGQAAADRDDALPAPPDDAPPNWPGYATSRARGYSGYAVAGARGYAAARAPDDAPRWLPNDGYAAPRPGDLVSPPGYTGMPQNRVPGWAARPAVGTGGLY